MCSPSRVGPEIGRFDGFMVLNGLASTPNARGWETAAALILAKTPADGNIDQLHFKRWVVT